MANLAHHLFERERDSADRTALVFAGREYTFSQIAARVRAIAGGLAEQGVTPGSRVGLMMNSRPEFIFFEQAIFVLGAIFTPLNIFYRKGELAHIFNSCELEYLVIDNEFLDRLPPPETVRQSNLKRIFVPGLPGAREDDYLRNADSLSAAAPARSLTELDDDDTVMMLNTSATTGKAKGVMLTVSNIRSNYDATPGWIGLDADTVILCALPLYNTFGLNQGINALMATGGKMILLPKFDAEQCLDAIETHGCTFFPAVPTMLQKIFDHPGAAARNLKTISCIFTGAAPVPAAILERIYSAMGRDTVVMTGYGLTEGTAIAAIDRIELDEAGRIRRPKSIGRPVPGVEIRILDQSGKDTAPGEVGEICVRGPNVAKGYYKSPQDTAQAFVGGWLHTGDLGCTDAEGYLYIVDRKKDVIIRGGQNIYPAEIEEVIYHDPAVAEVAVVAEEHEALGEVPVAYVALKQTGATDEAALIARCKDQLAYYKVPASIHFLDELPKGPTGKILRRGLRKQ